MIGQASQRDVRAFEQAMEQAGADTVTAVQDAAWWDVVGRFKQAAARFEQLHAQLLAASDYVLERPALRAQWDPLMARYEPIRAKVETIKQAGSAVVDWLAGVDGLRGLGVLPLIPIAVVAAALALVVKWSTDAVALVQRIAEQRRLEAAGVPAERASEIVARTAGDGGLFGDLGGTLGKGLAAAGLVGVLVWLLWQRRK